MQIIEEKKLNITFTTFHFTRNAPRENVILPANRVDHIPWMVRMWFHGHLRKPKSNMGRYLPSKQTLSDFCEFLWIGKFYLHIYTHMYMYVHIYIYGYVILPSFH